MVECSNSKWQVAHRGRISFKCITKGQHRRRTQICRIRLVDYHHRIVSKSHRIRRYNRYWNSTMKKHHIIFETYYGIGRPPEISVMGFTIIHKEFDLCMLHICSFRLCQYFLKSFPAKVCFCCFDLTIKYTLNKLISLTPLLP